jgi:glycosyltransferase involved in cell wall biosynthesis
MGNAGGIGYAVAIVTGTGIFMDYPLSIILPAKNEAGNLGPVLAQLAARFPTAEILVVDDGSTDATARIVREQGARVVGHPYSL